MIKKFSEFLDEKFDYTKQMNHTEFPEEKWELADIIAKTIKEKGPKCNLNFIDTSKIFDMSDLFKDSNFNGDISGWDVGQVVNMTDMFNSSDFNGDISNWNVKNVEYMTMMFYNSKFKGDINDWKPKKLKSDFNMFKKSPLEGNEPIWYESGLRKMRKILKNTKQTMKSYTEFVNEKFDYKKQGKPEVEFIKDLNVGDTVYYCYYGPGNHTFEIIENKIKTKNITNDQSNVEVYTYKFDDYESYNAKIQFYDDYNYRLCNAYVYKEEGDGDMVIISGNYKLLKKFIKKNDNSLKTNIDGWKVVAKIKKFIENEH